MFSFHLLVSSLSDDPPSVPIFIYFLSVRPTTLCSASCVLSCCRGFIVPILSYLPRVIVVFLIPPKAEYYYVMVTRYTSQTLWYIRCVDSGWVTPQLWYLRLSPLPCCFADQRISRSVNLSTSRSIVCSHPTHPLTLVLTFDLPFYQQVFTQLQPTSLTVWPTIALAHSVDSASSARIT